MTSFFEENFPPLTTPYSATAMYAVPAASALVVHALVQVREPFAHHFVVGLVATWIAVAFQLQKEWGVSFGQASTCFAQMFGVFTLTIFTSMSIYRVFFHPLRHVPGPLSAKLSMWSWVACDWFGNRARCMQQLHKTYGDVVRVGPREVSVANPAGLMAVYGPTGPPSKSVRGPWYGAQSMIPHLHSLQNEPTLPEHAKRRRDWDPAFSIKSLQSYEPNIIRNTDMLVEQVGRLAERSEDNRVDVKECLMWFGFDVMGELGFGRSFGTLEAGKTTHVVELVELGVRAINTLGNVPYMAQIMRFLPSPIQAFESWLADAVKWRKSKQGDREYVAADVFAYLLGEEKEKRHQGDPREIQQDCMLLVVAGSDTTSNTLAFCLYELARQPALIERLRQEVEDFAVDDFTALQDQAPFLNACLTETLRMWPAVPSGLQRETAVEHRLPGEVVVPPKTVLSTHTWTLHRDPRNFLKPDRFMPDRWMPNSKVSPHVAKAWSPFGFGATSCIGKNLAFMEMRMVLAHLVLKYDFNMEPSDSADFKDSIRDQFTAAAGQMWMTVTPR